MASTGPEASTALARPCIDDHVQPTKSNEMIHVPGNRVSPTEPLALRVRKGLTAAALLGAASGAWAVSDLPGGPAVRQLDLHPAVTRIASAQQDLHHMMMLHHPVMLPQVIHRHHHPLINQSQPRSPSVMDQSQPNLARDLQVLFRR